MHAIAQEIGADRAAGHQVVRLPSRNEGPGAALSLTAFVPSKTMYAFGTRAQVLLVIYERGVQSAPDIVLWEAALNLTPSQSRVACQLFQGKTMQEAAAALQIAPSTEESHLKDIYWKTATTCQSQLVLAMAALQSG